MKNNLLSENLYYTGDSEISTHLKLYSYKSTEFKEAKGKELNDIKHILDDNRVNWLKIYGLKDTETIREICEYFKINFLVLQDILNANHPTKIEEYDNYMVFILKLFRFNEENKEDEMLQQQLCIIQGSNYVLCFLEKDSAFFNNIYDAINNNTLKIREKQSDYLLSIILNNVMTNYTNIITDIDDALEDLEEELLKTTESKDIGVHIQALRKQYLQMKKAVQPLKEQYMRFLRSDSQLIHKANKPFFNDVNDHLQFVLQTIEICRETLASLVDLYISNNDLKMNDVMKRLTVVSTIFIPLTFLVGVWGMNFEIMPELKWQHGYLTAWLIILLIGVLIYLFFKKKKWY